MNLSAWCGVAVLGVGVMVGIDTVVEAQEIAPSPADKAFLAEVTQIDLTLVRLGTMAVSKAQSQQVKQLAQEMVNNHSALERQLAPFQQKSGVAQATMLDADHQASYDRLRGLRGKGFDEAYMETADKLHHRELETFRTEAATTHDAQLKQAVQQATVTIEKHTKTMDRVDDKLGRP